MIKYGFRSISLASCIVLHVAGCGGNNPAAPPKLVPPATFALAVTSVNPTSNAVISTISPADNNGVTTGSTNLSLTFNSGTNVTLTASASSSKGAFVAWIGCDTSTGTTCNVAMSGSRSVTAQYAGVTSVAITPSAGTATIPGTTQFSATVAGLGNCVMPSGTQGGTQACQGSGTTFSLTGPAGYTGFLGTLSASGLYTTAYPAPATVTVTATSQIDPTMTSAATLTLTAPAAAVGPALAVDLGNATHTISPFIYGINGYQMSAKLPALINLPLERWGGDSATRYNYLTDATNSAADWYYETNFPSAAGAPAISQFNSQVTQDLLTKTKTLATVPLIGYTTQRISACGYSVKKYGAQTVVDQYDTDCGTGLLGPLGGKSTGNVVNDPTDTSVAIDQTFVSGWVKFLVGQFGTAANGGVAMYAMDNEPEYWTWVHKDVHPKPTTYDELSTKGLLYAAAIKGQDPSALVTGPVVSDWSGYFYSAQDIASGYNHSPSCPQANPTDRMAHGNIPLIEYYLQKFKSNQDSTGIRLLDYLDIHTYMAAPNAGFATTGDTTLQQARLDSTRVFWDATYVDPNHTDPTNNSCTGKAFAPSVINMMKGWVAKDYPGTKLAITEYNWGGQEAINGALAQADILGIFGREGLDMGMLWGAPDPMKQFPGVAGFQAFTNYDGKNGHFGETALASTSTGQGMLAVYGARRTSDHAVTIVVINKGYGDLTSTLSLANAKPNGNAKAYLFSAANLGAIVALPDVTVTVPVAPSTTSTLSATFPAQSVTILAVPQI